MHGFSHGLMGMCSLELLQWKPSSVGLYATVPFVTVPLEEARSSWCWRSLAMLSYLSWVPCRATRLTIWLDPEPLTETPSGKLFLHTSYQSISASHAILWSFSVSALIHVHKLHFISICSAFNRMQEHFKFFFFLKKIARYLHGSCLSAFLQVVVTLVTI